MLSVLLNSIRLGSAGAAFFLFAIPLANAQNISVLHCGGTNVQILCIKNANDGTCLQSKVQMTRAGSVIKEFSELPSIRQVFSEESIIPTIASCELTNKGRQLIQVIFERNSGFAGDDQVMYFTVFGKSLGRSRSQALAYPRGRRSAEFLVMGKSNAIWLPAPHH